MKRHIASVLVLVMASVFCVGALAQQMVPNPMVEMESPAAVEEKLGVKLALPEDAVVGACYAIAENLGEVNFTWQGVNYCLRAQAGDELTDISGMYGDFAYTEDVEIEAFKVALSLNDGADGLALWYADGASNALIVAEGASEDALLNYLIEIC